MAQEQIGAHKLRQHQAFPSLPRLEYSRGEQVESLLRFPYLIQEGGKLHREIIAQEGKVRARLQGFEALFRDFPTLFQSDRARRGCAHRLRLKNGRGQMHPAPWPRRDER